MVTSISYCFYDDSHLCWCDDYDHQRLTNCFEFNPSIKHDCFGQSNCENEAHCLQDKSTCPQTSICVCPKCFYGTRCQFSSNLFGLSLDAILGYHIQPHTKIEHQPSSIVQFSIAFNKQKSKQMAKYIILLLLFLTIITTIHDPIYRRLIDDGDTEDEKRIWCIVTYPSSLEIFNFMINIFHFFAPFFINFISVFIIIKKTAQRRTRIQSHETYRQLLYKQFQQHSHLFLAPLLLIILAIPRLIISFTSGCMKSNNESWLFLIGYFISFIPSTLTFVVFVLPSKLYKKQFYKSIKQYRRKIQTRIYPIS